jgi:uncharacterized protein
MSNVIDDAKWYIESSQLGILATTGKDNIPKLRVIRGFANDGVNLYFATNKDTEKVKNINENSNVTLFFQNEGQDFGSFTNLSVTGIAKVVKDKEEINKAVDAISVRHPKLKKTADDNQLDTSGTLIYKVDAKSVKFLDREKSNKAEVVNL